ncbi:hypothetical protein [Aureimonas endophytica]|nr:hypothetical protein [Aureimonas endophytica]
MVTTTGAAQSSMARRILSFVAQRLSASTLEEACGFSSSVSKPE